MTRPAPAAALEAAFGAALRAHLDEHPAPGLHARALAAMERPLLAAALARCRGNRSRAAALLGLTRATLRRKLRHHGLEDL